MRTKSIKLIKEFPNSPKLETVLVPDSYGYYCGGFRIYTDVYEKFPEFFEEIDYHYEIVGFNDGFNDYWKMICGRFTINTQYLYTEKKLIDEGYKITAVKNILTGVVFRIGDTFTNHVAERYDKAKGLPVQTWVLTGFKFDYNTITLLHGEGKENCGILAGIKIDE